MPRRRSIRSNCRTPSTEFSVRSASPPSPDTGQLTSPDTGSASHAKHVSNRNCVADTPRRRPTAASNSRRASTPAESNSAGPDRDTTLAELTPRHPRVSGQMRC
jgi:hypothetical protein